jgi:hypothetical protein
LAVLCDQADNVIIVPYEECSFSNLKPYNLLRICYSNSGGGNNNNKQSHHQQGLVKSTTRIKRLKENLKDKDS